MTLHDMTSSILEDTNVAWNFTFGQKVTPDNNYNENENDKEPDRGGPRRTPSDAGACPSPLRSLWRGDPPHLPSRRSYPRPPPPPRSDPRPIHQSFTSSSPWTSTIPQGIRVPGWPNLQGPIPDRKRDGDNDWLQSRCKALGFTVLQVIILMILMNTVMMKVLDDAGDDDAIEKPCSSAFCNQVK